DFLIRNLMGIDGERGAIAVGAVLNEGAVVQFHLRDARTSASDLETMLNAYDASTPPAGALLFSCLGRGVHLYGQPDHDSQQFQRIVGEVPLAGFFCNGEIGQVHGSTFLHGYTSSFALFRPRFTRQ
ncbi:MAG TPA: FIST C-terminal domain-containing protein, partial [Candidatus Acidoferrales bacterium]|nr:FIST C-terminal domain-containing protein [Candidatus Acidoferrales bacterium]